MQSLHSQVFHKDHSRFSQLQLFFIVGMPRSGTTWLQEMINQHPAVVCRGEAHFVDIFYTLLRRAIHSYQEENATRGGTIAHLKKYGGHVETLDYTNEEIKVLLFEAMALMMSKWVDSDQIQAIGEKTPDNVMSIQFLAEMFPGSKFIHLIRDVTCPVKIGPGEMREFPFQPRGSEHAKKEPEPGTDYRQAASDRGLDRAGKHGRHGLS